MTSTISDALGRLLQRATLLLSFLAGSQGFGSATTAMLDEPMLFSASSASLPQALNEEACSASLAELRLTRAVVARLGEHRDDPSVERYFERLDEILTHVESVPDFPSIAGALTGALRAVRANLLQDVSAPRAWLAVARLLVEPGATVRLPERFIRRPIIQRYDYDFARLDADTRVRGIMREAFQES